MAFLGRRGRAWPVGLLGLPLEMAGMVGGGAVIFYGIWGLLYTTFFTNITGVGSGVWRSLGYWIVPAGRGPGRPALVLLLPADSLIRVSAAPLLSARGTLLLEKAGRVFGRFPRLLVRLQASCCTRSQARRCRGSW